MDSPNGLLIKRAILSEIPRMGNLPRVVETDTPINSIGIRHYDSYRWAQMTFNGTSLWHTILKRDILLPVLIFFDYVFSALLATRAQVQMKFFTPVNFSQHTTAAH
jgi:hypothetical protein